MGVLHHGILLGLKKGESFTFYNSMDGPGEITLSEISQSEKDKYHISHSYVDSNEHSELTSKIETDS